MQKVINLLRAVAGCDWGADKQSLIDIYRAIEVNNRLWLYSIWSSSKDIITKSG